MTAPPPPQVHIAADGSRWLWDGARWVPAPASYDPAGPPPRGSGAAIFIAVFVVLLIGGVTALLVFRSVDRAIDTATSRGVLPGPGSTSRSTSLGEPEGTKTFNDLSRTHAEGPIDYPMRPPAGGAHAGIWLTCATYTEPVPVENAVHSLEHGAVWVTYRPDLDSTQVTTLEAMVGAIDPSPRYVILSPYPDQSAPVMASAWGKQISVESAFDERLILFLVHFRRGQQTPEPGASCSRGVGAPG